MAKLTIVVAGILILMGVIGYVASGMVSPTALIPAFIGAPIGILGVLALAESRRKHAMHGAVLLALIGFAGSVPGLLQVGALLAGEAERPMAVAMQAVMAVLLAIYIALCVRSFIAARKARLAA
ncbi:MAG: hypothetical protein O3A53_00240 [Acidobacteria bacterium]|nr:hypothetical protein [Acidobacteriota bacterium]